MSRVVFSWGETFPKKVTRSSGRERKHDSKSPERFIAARRPRRFFVITEEPPGAVGLQSKVRATYRRRPPCRKYVTSISVSNSAVTEKDFPWLEGTTRIQTNDKTRKQERSVLHLHCELLPGPRAVGPGDAEPLLAAELQRVGAVAGQKLERHDAHPHQLALVQLLEALGDDRANPLKTGGDAQDDEGNAVFLVAIRRLEDVHLTGRRVLGPGLPMKRFWSLMLANVPLVITASFPRRAPYELNSRGVRLEGK
ncbi:hypothetical protein EYF80_009890 [Liparis tanakae]|uniref:Uncharacterized protein n=1 Tax=Liparis tanakae TaxID=230148 RepID=A0A4Z2IRN0_9TELE|nr:hypothetical protein EYF80_009890 [Liparis tanakae]